jgi:uncharacterized membrane protein YeaQ/YmgE (transglycosylase-associated protein family)
MRGTRGRPRSPHVAGWYPPILTSAGILEPSARRTVARRQVCISDRGEVVTMFQLIWIVIAGLVIGSLARLFLRGKQDIPIWLTILVGIGGALVGNIIASVIGVRDTAGIDWIRHILQVGVAAGLIVLLAPVWAARSSRSRYR